MAVESVNAHNDMKTNVQTFIWTENWKQNYVLETDRENGGESWMEAERTGKM